MFFPYWLSVVILSLALYGLWQFLRDLGGAWRVSRRNRSLSESLLIVFHNAEDMVEGHMRFLFRQIEAAASVQEVVVVDHGSDDLTPAILSRLIAGDPRMKLVHLPASARAVAEGMAFCQGDIVHVLDMESRVDGRDWDEIISRLCGRSA